MPITAMREAQLAKVKPARKNITPTVARNTIFGVWREASVTITVGQKYS